MTVIARTADTFTADAHVARDASLWQTELFAAAPALAVDAGVSARAAFQDVLSGRAVLLDLRPAPERARRGSVAAPPAARAHVRVAEPGAALADLARAGRVHLLGGEEGAIAPATFAAFDPADPRVTVVAGGFDAWLAAGLPVAGAAA